MSDLRELTRRFARTGRLEAIVLRPGRGMPAVTVESAEAVAGRGLMGDRAALRAPVEPGGGKRQVSLLQAEHLGLLAAWSQRADVDARSLRRNLVISGLNLIGARSPFADAPMHLCIGREVVLILTGPCDPCSRMEDVLGPGGYNAMRGHGGVTARVWRGGTLNVGDAVSVRPAEAD